MSTELGQFLVCKAGFICYGTEEEVKFCWSRRYWRVYCELERVFWILRRMSFFGFWKYGDEEFFISFVLFVVNFSFSYIYVKLFSLANHNLLNCC